MSRAEPLVGRKFLLAVSLIAAFLSAVPFLVAFAAGGRDALGFPVAADDNMVYAAWMRQAMEGRLFFDNRFTVDPQAGRTVHLYFLVLGWIAKIVGIPLALHGVRIVLVAVFVHRLGRFLERLGGDSADTKLALGLSLVAGGIGFLVWHDFGIALVKPGTMWAAGVLQSRLPIDAWQTEAFVLPSFLANGLFVAALLLILLTFEAALDVRESPKAIVKGVVALAVLANIHSYDAVIVGTVLGAFAIGRAYRRRLTQAWVGRALVIALGVLPAAAWLAYVLSVDPVFQSRAATPTYAATPRAMLAGLIVPILFAIAGLWSKKRLPGIGLLVVGMGILVGTATLGNGYPVPAWAFGAALVLFVAAAAICADGTDGHALLVTWAFVGLALPYFPALFERKLAMGLALPWGVLAAAGLAKVASHFPVGTRRLPLALASVVLGASAIRWFARDLDLVRTNVATTLVHPIVLSPDAGDVLRALAKEPGRKVAIAVPGGPNPALDESGKPILDRYLAPALPDLNPMLAGLGGAYAPAGHWSETPNYDARRAEVTRLFTAPGSVTLDELAPLGITHVVEPNAEAFPGLPARNFAAIGTVVLETPSYRLVRVGNGGAGGR